MKYRIKCSDSGESIAVTRSGTFCQMHLLSGGRLSIFLESKCYPKNAEQKILTKILRGGIDKQISQQVADKTNFDNSTNENAKSNAIPRMLIVIAKQKKVTKNLSNRTNKFSTSNKQNLILHQCKCKLVLVILWHVCEFEFSSK